MGRRLPCCAGFGLADQGSHSHPRGDFAPYRALFSDIPSVGCEMASCLRFIGKDSFGDQPVKGRTEIRKSETSYGYLFFFALGVKKCVKLVISVMTGVG